MAERPSPEDTDAPPEPSRHVKKTLLGRLGGNALSGVTVARMLKQDPEKAVASAIKLVSRMGDLKGLAMKMGQILSYTDFALPDQARDALATLQRHSSTMSWKQAEDVLKTELGTSAQVLIDGMDRVPVAAASIGQVFHATIDGAEVAVKVQYPGIEDAIRSDFTLAGIGPVVAKMVYPGSQNMAGLIDEVKERLLDECDYRKEAAYQSEFATAWEDHATLVIPKVFADYSTQRVLTMEWMNGRTIEEWLESDPSQGARDAAAEAIWDFYLGTLLLHGLYNGDPHPGNQLYLDDGRVAILDHGCARRFDAARIRDVARIIQAVHTDDRAMEAAIKEAGLTQKDKDLETAKDLMRAFFSPLHDPAAAAEARVELNAAMGAKRRMMRLAIPPEFMLLLRIRFGLAALLGQIGGNVDWSAKELGLADHVLSNADD